MRIFIFLFLFITGKSIFAGEIFDDFNYSNNKFPVEGDSSGSIYGRNPWITEDSVIYSRAWHRYNFDGHQFSEYCNVTAQDSIIKLSLMPGFDESKYRGPMFISGFLLDHGTFAARIKLAELPDDKIIQAFWLTSTVHYLFDRDGEKIRYWDEMDFEWNNWFISKDPKENMTIGCNNENGRYIRNTAYDFMAETKYGKLHFPKGQTSFKGTDYFHDVWYLCWFVLDSAERKVSIYMFDDDESIDAEVYAVSGEPGEFTTGFEIDNYYPEMPLITVFSLHVAKMNHNLDFYVDWFYYSEDVIYEKEKILQNVDNLKSNNYSRLNSTGKNLLHPGIDTSNVVFEIAGPDTIRDNSKAEFSIYTNYYLWGGFEVDFAYRFITDAMPGDWINIYDKKIPLDIPAFADEIELKLTLFEYWNDFRDTVQKKVKVIREKHFPRDKFQVKINPNPVLNTFQLMLDVYEENVIEIALFNLSGKRIREISHGDYNPGRYDFIVNLSDCANGHYFIVIKTENHVATKKIIKLKN